MKNTRIEKGSLTDTLIGLAIEVHRVLGPGLLESSYEECLCYELEKNKVEFERQVPLPINYKGMDLDCGYRVDILVPGSLIVELKSVCALKTIHEAQLLTYMKLAGIGTGLLINFNVPLLRNGIKRMVL